MMGAACVLASILLQQMLPQLEGLRAPPQIEARPCERALHRREISTEAPHCRVIRLDEALREQRPPATKPSPLRGIYDAFPVNRSKWAHI